MSVGDRAAAASADDLAEWIPIRLFRERGELLVDWCYRGGERFKDPFCEQTVDRCLRRPFAAVFRRHTTLAEFSAWHARSPGLAPTGLIFHMSRCGSTLVSQMLAALPRNIVLSEPPVLDAMLRATSPAMPLDPEQHAAWLRALVSALAQPLAGEQNLFIKLDAWHTAHLPLIRRAFPETPWIFLYRDDVEAIASHVARRGAHMVPGLLGLDPLGLDPAEAARLPVAEYVARVLGKILADARDVCEEGAEGNGRLMHYRELPAAVGTTLASHFRIAFSAQELERMQHITQFDAKEPSLFFAPDAEAKREGTTEAVRAAAARWVAPIYERLEQLRHAQK